MRLVEARFEVERMVQARGLHGCSIEVEAVGCELADASTVVAYIYFMGDEEPLTLVIDLEAPVTEETLDRDALSQALLSSSPAPSVH